MIAVSMVVKATAAPVMLTRLEKNGLLKHETEGQRYIYSSGISPGAARKSALQTEINRVRKERRENA